MNPQDDLFREPPPPPPPVAPAIAAAAGSGHPAPRRRRGSSTISAQPQDEPVGALARSLPPHLRLGTSTWSYPGWQGLVWEGAHSEQQLAKSGLTAYAQHPLLRTVSIDRSFYRPLTVSEYERYAAQVPDDFRFVVKAPSLVTDALVRSEEGRGREPNPAFLSPELARSEFVEPALAGLGRKLGVLVFQLSPMALSQLDRLPQVVERLHAMLRAQPRLAPAAPDGVMAVEVRDPEWLAPDIAPLLARALRDAGATYCLGLHPKMPPLRDQLPLLRALWPGPLVCRWNLNPIHGPYGYEEAERLYAPYNRLHHPDLDTRTALASEIAGSVGRGQNAFVTISNHAEGCAPATVQGLAECVAAALPPQAPGPAAQ